jgi:uncharacterized protein YndB with AHSA1/START domain
MTPAGTDKGTTLQVRRTIPASREAVFRAWTDPDVFRQWFGARGGSTLRADMDVRVGGHYRIDMESSAGTGSLFGEYLEVKNPERLVYTFCWDALPVAIPDTQVTVEFHERGKDTEVVITHERQPSRGVLEFHEWGWDGSLEKLAELLGKTKEPAGAE